MADIVSLSIEGAVAVGTIGLTVLAAYQLRRDRREALARELADRVYVPMRKDATGWQNPESLPYTSTWKALEENVPYLTIKVPSEIRKLFAKAEELNSKIWIYVGPTTEFIRSQSVASGANTTIRLMKGEQFLGEIYPINIWKSQKTFAQYTADFMARNRPLIKGWSLVLWVDIGGTQGNAGGTKESTEYIEKVFKFLESKQEAVTYRNIHQELAQVGAKAFALIEKELRKRVAPQSSSPAKEPGNPFG
jgi:hypothetical protein